MPTDGNYPGQVLGGTCAAIVAASHTGQWRCIAYIVLCHYDATQWSVVPQRGHLTDGTWASGECAAALWGPESSAACSRGYMHLGVGRGQHVDARRFRHQKGTLEFLAREPTRHESNQVKALLPSKGRKIWGQFQFSLSIIELRPGVPDHTAHNEHTEEQGKRVKQKENRSTCSPPSFSPD